MNKLRQIYRWLDNSILPWPVKFLTNPLVIIFTFLTLIPLIGWANAVVFVLIVNSYMNVTSVGTSSIVLRQQLISTESQEKRAQQDHEAIITELMEIKEMHAELRAMHEELLQMKKEQSFERQ